MLTEQNQLYTPTGLYKLINGRFLNVNAISHLQMLQQILLQGLGKGFVLT